MNIISLTGRLTRDPELKYGQSGKAYARFSIAVNRAFSRDEVDFINCVAFGGAAETIGKYFRKGSQIGVTGRLQMNRYETQTGEKRTSYDVIVDGFDFLDPKNTNNQGNYGQNQGNYGQQNNYNQGNYGQPNNYNQGGYGNNNVNIPMGNNNEPEFYSGNQPQQNEPTFTPPKKQDIPPVDTSMDDDEFPF